MKLVRVAIVTIPIFILVAPLLLAVSISSITRWLHYYSESWMKVMAITYLPLLMVLLMFVAVLYVMLKINRRTKPSLKKSMLATRLDEG